MSEFTTPADAVYAAYYASFDCPSYEVHNPERRGLDVDRFVRELDRIGWRPYVTATNHEAVRYPLAYRDVALAAADDDAFTEGEVDCGGESHLNSWSADAFVAECEARGVDFMVSA